MQNYLRNNLDFIFYEYGAKSAEQYYGAGEVAFPSQNHGIVLCNSSLRYGRDSAFFQQSFYHWHFIMYRKGYHFRKGRDF